MKKQLLIIGLLALSACQQETSTDTQNAATEIKQTAIAPGVPGEPPVWAYAGKTGIGSSYEQYVDGAYQTNDMTGKVSKVWFSLAQGIVTETMFGMIHQAQIKDMQVIMVGSDFVDSEQDDTHSQISYLHTDDKGRPLSPAYKIVNTDKEGKYTIEKHIFTDPSQQSLFVKYYFSANEAGILPVLTVNPHINNDGSGDQAWIEDNTLYASDSGTYLTLKSNQAFTQQAVGFIGTSDAISDAQDFKMSDAYTSTGEQGGNVSLTGVFNQIPVGETLEAEVVLGFGYSQQTSLQAAQNTLNTGYQAVLDHYNGAGDLVGWEDYLQSLDGLTDMAKVSTDGGALAYSSALVLKIQEDKTHAGALIASLSNPWGDSVSAEKGATGYKAVWPRDFYQCAMALLALGDKQTPKVAFEYLKKVQVTKDTPNNNGVGGWFLQKTHVDGELEWVAMQADQTGMPIMLGWKLWQAGVFTDREISDWYQAMLKPAADFLTDGGKTDLAWADHDITLPWTQQERWEEQQGYSPSSTAATIAGLVSAAEIAVQANDEASAKRYLEAADQYSASIEKTMFTTTGKHNHNGKYFLRVTANQDPNDDGLLEDRNGRGQLREKDVLDGGFLELVRYGVRAANDPYIVDTLEELDDMTLEHPLRVKYEFKFDGDDQTYPGWRRYGLDGYGEDFVTGLNYGETDSEDGMSINQRGRVWPFFTGERGHYELAKGVSGDQLRQRYVKGLEHFANEGLMLPEQVFDGVGVNPKNRYHVGEGTNGATPLAWTHAEYVKLLRSIADQQVWDSYPPVIERFQNTN